MKLGTRTLTTWNRNEVLASVQRDVWRYFSSSSTPEDVPGAAERLFDLQRGQLRRLAAAHLVLDPLTQQMLEAGVRVLRELPSVVSRSEVEFVGAVRGPVNWTRTRERQLATADRSRFICRPADRRYDTPLARLVRLALAKCVEAADLADVSGDEVVGRRIHSARETARHLLLHRKLVDVRPVKHLPDRTLESLRRYPHTGPLIDFVQQAREGIELLHPAAVRAIVNARILAPLTDDRLFELLVGFRITKALRDLGFVERWDLIESGSQFAVLDGPVRILMYWQRHTWGVYPAKGHTSHYRQILDAAAMQRGSLRPDFLLVAGLERRPLFVEVKQTRRDDQGPERAGVAEMLAYLRDADHLIADWPPPYGLVVGWNASGTPALAEVIVSDQNSVKSAVALVVSAWTS